jgi:hypothetical protein
VPEELWQAAKARQDRTRYAIRQTGKLASANRPRYLFSGLTKCGVCGAGFVLSYGSRLACFGARDQGTCDNRLTIRRETSRRASWRRCSTSSFARTARREELEARLASADEPPPLLHPSMANLYRERVAALAEALEHPDTRTEAVEAIRGLIDAIVLTPVEGALEAFVARRGRRAPAEIAARDSGLRIELKGNLAAMLGAAQNATRSPKTGDLELRIAMVAGAGFEPATFGL